jgi:hypothetical protein
VDLKYFFVKGWNNACVCFMEARGFEVVRVRRSCRVRMCMRKERRELKEAQSLLFEELSKHGWLLQELVSA